jgi:integrase
VDAVGQGRDNGKCPAQFEKSHCQARRTRSSERSKQTRDEQGKQLDRLKIAFGHFLPDSVTPRHCYKYADARRSKDGKPVPVAARHEVTLLGHVFRYAIRWGLATINPATSLDVGKRTGKRRQVTMQEVESVRALAPERVQVIMDFAVSTGQRLGDILDFKRTDLTVAGLMIDQGKTGAKIAMEITPALGEIIARAKSLKPQLGVGAEYLIRSRNGKRYTESGFKAIWQRLMRKYAETGAKRFTFHDLRSVSADGAVTAEEARARLGHTNVSTTKRFYLRGAEKAKPRE